jgi:hypothetical protein
VHAFFHRAHPLIAGLVEFFSLSDLAIIIGAGALARLRRELQPRLDDCKVNFLV